MRVCVVGAGGRFGGGVQTGSSDLLQLEVVLEHLAERGTDLRLAEREVRSTSEIEQPVEDETDRLRLVVDVRLHAPGEPGDPPGLDQRDMRLVLCVGGPVTRPTAR